MNEVFKIKKYPRTPHLEGSRLQPGDEDLSQIPFLDIKGKNLVVEEKCDGANSAISFDADGTLLIQSRGHYLAGGYKERHYDLLKQWANYNTQPFYNVLGTRYIMYGEWMYAKHKVYYDALPSYFLEFDIYDREKEIFLDSETRHQMLEGLPVVSVPIIKSGSFFCYEDLVGLITASRYITKENKENLRRTCLEKGVLEDSIFAETDTSGLMEGLYIKVEEDGQVTDRLKFVRREFYQAVISDDSNWQTRTIIPNQLSISLEEFLWGKGE